MICNFYFSIKGSLNLGVCRNPFQSVEVPVNLIQYVKGVEGIPFEKRRYTNFLFLKFRIAGVILDGDWDQRKDKKKIDEIYTYTGCLERFIEGRAWEDTVVFNHFFKKARRNNGFNRECATWDEYRKRHLERWDAMFYDMKSNGYKSQSELHGKAADEVQVGVTSDGEILFFDGIHRICMAKILKIVKIPVLVNIWHKAFIDRANSYYGSKNVTPEAAIQLILNRQHLGTAD